MIQLVTIGAVGPTLNQWYAGGHWSKRSEIKNNWRILVNSAIKAQNIQPVTDYPVSIDCRIVFGPGRKRYDWENGAATAKLIQDGLVKAGILVDDSPKYIIGGRIWCVKGDTSKTIIVIRNGKDIMEYN